MARKRWTPKGETTPELQKIRDKRKWQINLRRYVIEQTPCPFYAPFFGLDIQNLRKWFEVQFRDGLSWSDYGKGWQFEHILPVTYFDFSDEAELKLCWNFTNLKVLPLQGKTEQGNRLDILAAKTYFTELYEKTLYVPCRRLLEKINKLETSETIDIKAQQIFLAEHRSFLDLLENYSAFEFELLNRGHSIDEVKKEADFLKSLKTKP